jgi:hypothetical protein
MRGTEPILRVLLTAPQIEVKLQAEYHAHGTYLQVCAMWVLKAFRRN